MMELQPFTAEREWTVDGIPVLSAAVSVPQPIPTDRIARRLHRYYQLQCRSYLRYCEKQLFPQAQQEYQAALANSAPLPQFRAELTYQITYQDSHFLSLYTQSAEWGPHHQTLTLRRGDTWDLIDGYPIPLSAFFPNHSPWRRQLLGFAAKEIQRQEDAGTAQYHDSWKKSLRRCFNPQNYYLTKDGLVFFFPMFALAPAIEGIPTFLIPYAQTSVSPGVLQPN